jgi:hypothetical protein
MRIAKGPCSRQPIGTCELSTPVRPLPTDDLAEEAEAAVILRGLRVQQATAAALSRDRRRNQDAEYYNTARREADPLCHCRSLLVCKHISMSRHVSEGPASLISGVMADRRGKKAPARRRRPGWGSGIPSVFKEPESRGAQPAAAPATLPFTEGEERMSPNGSFTSGGERSASAWQ